MQYFCILFKAALEDAAASNGLPLEEKSLSEILGTDEYGSPKMYTTLYVDQNRIISTNDPGFVLPGRRRNRARRHLRQPGRGLLLCSGALTVLAVRKKKLNKQPIIPPRSESVLNAADKKEPVRMKLHTGSFLLAFAVSQGVSAVLHSIRHPTPAWPHRRSLWHPSHRSLLRSPWHNPGSAPRRPP